MTGEVHGHRFFTGHRSIVGTDRPAGEGVGAAESTHTGASMISLPVIYGALGFGAALLLVYLVYALIRAEEF